MKRVDKGGPVGRGLLWRSRRAVGPALPGLESAPVLTGAPVIGQALACTTGVWSGTGTLSYARQWMRGGAAIGGASGATYVPTAADDLSDVSCVVTATDANGSRSAASNAVGVTYAAPVAAGALSDQSFAENSGVRTYDASVDFSGSNLTFTINQTAGISIDNSSGVVSFDTDAMAVQSLTAVLVTATNSGGADTSGLSLTITAAPSGTITIDSLTYTRGPAGVAPDLEKSLSSTGTPTGPYTLFWATRSTGAALSKSAIENGTGDALDHGTITAANLADLDGPLDLSTSLVDGSIDTFVRDSSAPPIESAVATAGSVTYDAVAPTFASAVIENADPDAVILTLDKAAYVAVGETLESGDWTFGGDLAAEVTGVVRTSATVYTFSLSRPAVNGETLTVALAAGTLVGVDAEDVAFTAQSVTNNVAPAATLSLLGTGANTANAGVTRTYAMPASTSGNRLIIFVHYSSTMTFTSLSVNGLTPTERGTESVQGNTKVRVFEVVIDTSSGFNIGLVTGTAFGWAAVVVYDVGSKTFSSRQTYTGNNPTATNSIAIASSETAGRSLVAVAFGNTSNGSFSAGTNIDTTDLTSFAIGASFIAGAAHQDSIVGGSGVTYAMSLDNDFVNTVGVFMFYS